MDPDKDAITLLRKAIKKNRSRCRGLGDADTKEHFFSLAHHVYERVIGKIVSMACTDCGCSEDILVKQGESPPNPDTFICDLCLHPDDEDE